MRQGRTRVPQVRRQVKSWGTVKFKVFDADGEFKTFTFHPPMKNERYTREGLYTAAAHFMGWLTTNCPKAQFRLVPIQGNKFNIVPDGTPVAEN
jgi:hypothetical protein